MAIYSEFSHKKMVIFHSYVSLPEGKGYPDFGGCTPTEYICCISVGMM